MVKQETEVTQSRGARTKVHKNRAHKKEKAEGGGERKTLFWSALQHHCTQFHPFRILNPEQQTIFDVLLLCLFFNTLEF